MTTHCFYESPLGRMLLTTDAGALTGLYFMGQKYFPAQDLTGIHAMHITPLPQARAELDEYFAGQRQQFTVPLAPQGTPFQMKVWQCIARVRYGSVLSYSELAKQAANIRSARAVGAATGRNPLSIIIPCHRIIATDGGLTGYAGGIPRKQALLHLEATTGTT